MKRSGLNAQNVAVSLHLDWCTYKAASYAVSHWHYSQRMPDPKCVKIGVWENKKFVGVVIFSRGVSGTAIAKGLNLEPTEVAELSRVALTTHITAVTKIIKVAVMLLKKKDAGLKLLVSYADENQGHIGSIYQGGNWIYVGQSAAVPIYTDKKGKRIHDRSCSSTGYKKQFGVVKKCANIKELTKISQLRKWKYYLPLDGDTRKQIQMLSQPYPKRGGQLDGHQIPSGEGSAILTPPLHIDNV